MEDNNQQIPDVVFDEAQAFEEGFASNEETTEEQIQQVIQENPSLTEEQIRGLFAENNQRIFGQIGEFSRGLQEVRQLASQAHTFTPQNFQIMPENLSKIREEFGEEFSAALAHDLSKIPMQQIQQGFDKAQIDEYISGRLTEAQNQFETKLVSMAHPDWKDVVNSSDFENWTKNQPPQIQEMLQNSWDSEFITTAIGAFKRENSRKQQVTQKRTNRLASAVTPNGTGGSYDEEDDFEAGFNSTIKRT